MPLPRYTLRQLEAFATVAELLSFTDAADRLALTPSAVSQLVTELETALELKLFERTTRRVALSAAGREFLVAAELVLKHLRLAERSASDVRNRASPRRWCRQRSSRTEGSGPTSSCGFAMCRSTIWSTPLPPATPTWRSAPIASSAIT